MVSHSSSYTPLLHHQWYLTVPLILPYYITSGIPQLLLYSLITSPVVSQQFLLYSLMTPPVVSHSPSYTPLLHHQWYPTVPLIPPYYITSGIPQSLLYPLITSPVVSHSPSYTPLLHHQWYPTVPLIPHYYITSGIPQSLLYPIITSPVVSHSPSYTPLLHHLWYPNSYSFSQLFCSHWLSCRFYILQTN